MKLLRLADLSPSARETIRGNLEACREAISRAAHKAGRSPDNVEMVVVTKYVDADVVRLLYDLGVRAFGENRLQQATAKLEMLTDLDGARYHFIGHLQRNKVRRALEYFGTVHSLDSLRLLRELEARLADSRQAAPDVYVEVNVAKETQKTGLGLEEAPEVLGALRDSEAFSTRIKGLMTMAPHAEDSETARPHFRRLREIRDEFEEQGLLPPGAGLSMGMSSDFRVAVEEGATLVRIGSMLFES